MTDYRADAAFAAEMDRADPLAGYRERFAIPTAPSGDPVHYFTGNSLGLMPKAAAAAVTSELEDWAEHAVEGHFRARSPWYRYHEQFAEAGARLVGARPGEVVMMNTLTVNLHLMMVSFYRPTRRRAKILIESPAFPSDTYAVKSQLAFHGIDPAEGLLEARPREGEHTIRTEDLEALIHEQGDTIALVMLGGVNFFTGQRFDLARITAAAKARGCVVGFDLAHAAGNVPLRLHDDGADFAVWCNYKYLNSGPGAVGGCFVHESHGDDATLPRFAGWWGNDPDTRFKMQLIPDFVPFGVAEGWQLSNPPILAMAPIRASLAIFDELGMPALRAKSERLTGYFAYLMEGHPSEAFEVITPREPEARGCQLSILVHDRPRERFAALEKAGVIADFREPNVIRVAPVPLYNTFHDVYRFVEILTGETQDG